MSYTSHCEKLKSFIFVHIGKNAGTTLKAALGEISASSALIDIEQPLIEHSIPCADRISKAPVNSLLFCVRDPVTRFLSAWRSRYEQGFPHYHFDSEDFAKFRDREMKWKGDLADIFNLYSTPEDYLQSIVHGRTEMNYIDHFVPQLQVLCGKVFDLDCGRIMGDHYRMMYNVNKINFVLQYEKLNEHWALFLQQNDLPEVPLQHLHRQDHNQEYPPWVPRCPPGWRDLSDESRAKLVELYQEDYQLIELLAGRFEHIQAKPQCEH